jgi:predicted aspartyl protease
METILVILGELESLESLVKFAKKNHDENLKSVNLTKVEGLVVVRRISVNKNHHNKTLHLLVEINNHLVEGLVDTWASMSVMSADVVGELGIIHLVFGSKS